jgi:hypothetical protein
LYKALEELRVNISQNIVTRIIFQFYIAREKDEKENYKKGIEDYRKIVAWNISGLFSFFDYCENME